MAFFRRESPTSQGAATSPSGDAPTGATSAPTGTPAAPLAALPAPKAERLDRSKLSILAAFAGMGVIGMVVFMQPPAPNGAATRTDAPPPQAGTYLDQPMRHAVPPGSASGATGGAPAGGAASAAPGTYGAYDAGAAADAQLAPGYAPLPPSPEPYGPAAYGPAGDGYAASGVYAPPTPPPPTAAELRAAAYRRALDASPTGEEPAGARATVASPGALGVADGEGTGAVATMAAGQGGGEAGAGTGAVTRADQFMQTAALASGQRTVQALTVQAAPGPYSVQAGTVIPAVLMTEINSDLPGECLAQITRDVYDSRAQRHLLIPRGAKLLCKYDDQLTTGQSRLLVAWTRILLPDGRSVSLPGLPATDAAGARGVSDQVDRHARRAFGTAAALSIIGAGAQLAQPQRGSILTPPSAGQVMAGALGQQLNQVAVEMLRRDLSNRQTIRIRQGVEFNVFLNTDLTFPAPYGASAGPTAPAARATAWAPAGARGVVQR